MSPVQGSDYCISHSPSLTVARQEWRVRGGHNSRRQYKDLAVTAPRTIAEAQELLAQTMAGIAAGEINPRVGQIVASLVREYVRLAELQTLQDKVSALEQYASNKADN